MYTTTKDKSLPPPPGAQPIAIQVTTVQNVEILVEASPVRKSGSPILKRKPVANPRSSNPETLVAISGVAESPGMETENMPSMLAAAEETNTVPVIRTDTPSKPIVPLESTPTEPSKGLTDTAEILHSILTSANGTKCKHFPKLKPAETSSIPHRLAFLSANGETITHLKLDALCQQCYRLVVPTGFNVWLTGFTGVKRGELFPVMGGIRATKDEVQGPMPASVSREEVAAFKWLRKQNRPFFVDQCHLGFPFNPEALDTEAEVRRVTEIIVGLLAGSAAYVSTGSKDSLLDGRSIVQQAGPDLGPGAVLERKSAPKAVAQTTMNSTDTLSSLPRDVAKTKSSGLKGTRKSASESLLVPRATNDDGATKTVLDVDQNSASKVPSEVQDLPPSSTKVPDPAPKIRKTKKPATEEIKKNSPDLQYVGPDVAPESPLHPAKPPGRSKISSPSDVPKADKASMLNELGSHHHSSSIPDAGASKTSSGVEQVAKVRKSGVSAGLKSGMKKTGDNPAISTESTSKETRRSKSVLPTTEDAGTSPAHTTAITSSTGRKVKEVVGQAGEVIKPRKSTGSSDNKAVDQGAVKKTIKKEKTTDGPKPSKKISKGIGSQTLDDQSHSVLGSRVLGHASTQLGGSDRASSGQPSLPQPKETSASPGALRTKSTVPLKAITPGSSSALAPKRSAPAPTIPARPKQERARDLQPAPQPQRIPPCKPGVVGPSQTVGQKPSKTQAQLGPAQAIKPPRRGRDSVTELKSGPARTTKPPSSGLGRTRDTPAPRDIPMPSIPSKPRVRVRDDVRPGYGGRREYESRPAPSRQPRSGGRIAPMLPLAPRRPMLGMRSLDRGMKTDGQGRGGTLAPIRQPRSQGHVLGGIKPSHGLREATRPNRGPLTLPRLPGLRLPVGRGANFGNRNQKTYNPGPVRQPKLPREPRIIRDSCRGTGKPLRQPKLPREPRIIRDPGRDTGKPLRQPKLPREPRIIRDPGRGTGKPLRQPKLPREPRIIRDPGRGPGKKPALPSSTQWGGPRRPAHGRGESPWDKTGPYHPAQHGPHDPRYGEVLPGHDGGYPHKWEPGNQPDPREEGWSPNVGGRMDPEDFSDAESAHGAQSWSDLSSRSQSPTTSPLDRDHDGTPYVHQPHSWEAPTFNEKPNGEVAGVRDERASHDESEDKPALPVSQGVQGTPSESQPQNVSASTQRPSYSRELDGAPDDHRTQEPGERAGPSSIDDDTFRDRSQNNDKAAKMKKVAAGVAGVALGLGAAGAAYSMLHNEDEAPASPAREYDTDELQHDSEHSGDEDDAGDDEWRSESGSNGSAHVASDGIGDADDDDLADYDSVAHGSEHDGAPENGMSDLDEQSDYEAQVEEEEELRQDEVEEERHSEYNDSDQGDDYADVSEVEGQSDLEDVQDEVEAEEESEAGEEDAGEQSEEEHSEPGDDDGDEISVEHELSDGAQSEAEVEDESEVEAEATDGQSDEDADQESEVEDESDEEAEVEDESDEEASEEAASEDSVSEDEPEDISEQESEPENSEQEEDDHDAYD
ncbi:hypothetical protein LTR17_027175 [Elasticomyces elasticus]|nr:hypothetical protein LTR17_027175 [Elasticomyces elasticus]